MWRGERIFSERLGIKSDKKRKKKMIISEFSIIPIGTKTTSVSRYVKAALEELKKEEGIRVKAGAMGTVIEAGNLRDLLSAVERAHEVVFKLGAGRVVTEIKIDDRRDGEASIEKKLGALK